MKEDIPKYEHVPFSTEPLRKAEERIAEFLDNKGNEKPDSIRRRMQSLMMEYCSVFRNEEGLKKGIEEIRYLKQRYRNIGIADKGRSFNYELMEAIELGNQLDLCEVILLSALHRKESRGAHFREDFSARDDKNYLKHTLVFKTQEGQEVRYKPVKLTKFQPEARVY